MVGRLGQRREWRHGLGEGRKFRDSCQEPRQNRRSRNYPSGVGIFALLCLGGRKDAAGPTISGSSAWGLASGVPASSVVCIYSREWGTESKGLGFLKEKKRS